jgi:PPM family protein phosphatase
MSEVSPGGARVFSFGEACNRGKVREENQDTIRSATIPLGELFLVADGIGGYQGGATASLMVADGFHEQLAAQPAGYPADAALREACAYTNASIHAAAQSGDPSLQRMGSTVVLALIQAEAPGFVTPMARYVAYVAWIGHVGDSRAYLIRNGRMIKLTSDHSAVQALLNRNLITEKEALNHPDASVLTRSLGHRPEVEIELDRVPLQAGDGLLLCSDGLWGYVTDEDIAAVATDGELSAQTIADTLLHQALAAGGQDNIGIEFVRIEGITQASVIAAPLTEPPPVSPLAATGVVSMRANRAKTQQIVAIGLLLLGGCGFLGYAAYNHGWPSRPSVPSQPDHGGVTKPALEKKILVVGDIPGAGAELPSPFGTVHWQHIQITRASRRACADLGEEGPVVYADPRENMTELLLQHPELGKVLSALSPRPLTPGIRNACGAYDVILILPKRN